MDPGQNHLLIAGLSKPFYLFYDLLRLAATDSSPYIRDNTIGTELVAPILDFDVGSCMIPGRVNIELFKLSGVIDINHSFYILMLFIVMEQCDEILLLVVADQDINSFDLCPRLLLGLDIASRRYNHGVRIEFSGPGSGSSPPPVP